MAEILKTLPGGKLAATDMTVAKVAATTPATFANDGQTLLAVTVGATPTNLTLTGQPCSHGRPISTVVALLANKDYLLGPFPTAEYNDGNGKMNISFSSVATVTVAAISHNN